MFPDRSDIEVRGTAVSCRHDPHLQLLTCRSPVAGTIQLKVIAPAETIPMPRGGHSASIARTSLDTRVRVC